jgi:RNA polymerase sigma factor (sigma-70 family)
MYFPLLQEPRSLDEFVDAERSTRLAVLLADPSAVSPEDRLYALEIRRLVGAALARLDERELHIIRNRFGLAGGDEMTLEEIGRSLHLSRERVRQLERDAKRKLRTNLDGCVHILASARHLR